MRLLPSAGPLRFSPSEKAALLALAYRYPVFLDLSEDEDGNAMACVVPDEGGLGVAWAYPVRTGGIWATDEALNHLGTFWTAEDLAAALAGHLDALWPECRRGRA